MGLKAGIVGLPNVGKSTLFNAVTNSQVEAANYPFATIEPNQGIVELHDERLEQIAKIVMPEKLIKATFEFIDIAGLVKGASQGEGLGNKFLSNIREVDAIVQVVRCFENDDITHVAGKIDPVDDIKTIDTELLLADMETVSNVLKRVERKALQTKEKSLMAEYTVAKKIMEQLEKEVPARELNLSEDDIKTAKSWNLLTIKPIIYVGNVDERDINDPDASSNYQSLKTFLNGKYKLVPISAKIEGELSELEEEDRQVFMEDLGIIESGLNKIVKAAFDTLNLSTYFTAGKKEVRAWIFKNGQKAPQCAGVIHTDFERGFIKADVVGWQDFVSNNGEQGARSAGKYRLEGKDYVFQDGDISEFKFNV